MTIFLIVDHQLLFSICNAFPHVWNQLPPSTSFCSLSSWFTSSCTQHPHQITVRHHLSLPQPFTPDLKPIYSTILFSIVCVVPFGLEMIGNGFSHSHSLPFPHDQFPFLPIPIRKQSFNRCGINIFCVSRTRLLANIKYHSTELVTESNSFY